MFISSCAMRRTDLFIFHARTFFMRHIVAFPIAPLPLPSLPTSRSHCALALTLPSHPRLPIVPLPSLSHSCPHPHAPIAPLPSLLRSRPHPCAPIAPLPSLSRSRPHPCAPIMPSPSHSYCALALAFLPLPSSFHSRLPLNFAIVTGWQVT